MLLGVLLSGLVLACCVFFFLFGGGDSWNLWSSGSLKQGAVSPGNMTCGRPYSLPDPPWVEPSNEMLTHMVAWRETKLKPTAHRHHVRKFGSTNNLTVFAGDPLRNVIPRCDVKQNVLLLGDSHIRDIGELLCLMQGFGTNCVSMAPREPGFPYFDFPMGKTKVHVRWLHFLVDRRVSKIFDLPDMDLILFGSGAWLPVNGIPMGDAIEWVKSTLVMLRNLFPRARIVLVLEWHRFFFKHFWVKNVEARLRAAHSHKRYFCHYAPEVIQELRSAFVCGALQFVGAGSGSNLCNAAEGIFIWDSYNITRGIPRDAITDGQGHHFYSSYGEAVTLALVREHICPVARVSELADICPMTVQCAREFFPAACSQPSRLSHPMCVAPPILRAEFKQDARRREQFRRRSEQSSLSVAVVALLLVAAIVFLLVKLWSSAGREENDAGSE